MAGDTVVNLLTLQLSLIHIDIRSIFESKIGYRGKGIYRYGVRLVYNFIKKVLDLERYRKNKSWCSVGDINGIGMKQYLKLLWTKEC